MTAAKDELSPAAPKQLSLDEVIRIGLERQPRLAQAAFAIDAAAGRAIQAGLYPNPSLVITGDELGDRTGVGGIWTAPQFNQDIVTGGKLKLSRAAALREVDQATLALLNERYTLFGSIRQVYYEVLAIQRRIELLGELQTLAGKSVEATERAIQGGRSSKLDLLQLQIERDRLAAELSAAQRERAAAFRRLAAAAGTPDLPDQPLAGFLEGPIPDYEYDVIAPLMIANHPEIRLAKVGIERAQLLLQRAQVEPIPNINVGTGYTRQNQNKSSDWMLSFSLPLPVWNKNQGNIRAAQAELGEAGQRVRRAEMELVNRMATSFGAYSAARERARRYQESILPAAREALELSLKAYQGGQFEYLRVLQAQRSVSEATLEYTRTLGDAWRAAGELSALAMDEAFPAGRK